MDNRKIREQAFKRCWNDTWLFFGDWKHVLMMVAVAPLVGLCLHRAIGDQSTIMEEAWTIGVYGLASVVVCFLAVLFWQFIRAPYRQRDEARKYILEHINYTDWLSIDLASSLLRETLYDLGEADRAAWLDAADDEIDNGLTIAASDMIFQAINEGKLIARGKLTSSGEHRLLIPPVERTEDDSGFFDEENYSLSLQSLTFRDVEFNRDSLISLAKSFKDEEDANS